MEAKEEELGLVPDKSLASFMAAIGSSSSQHSLITDLMLRLLGLESVADTPVVRRAGS